MNITRTIAIISLCIFHTKGFCADTYKGHISIQLKEKEGRLYRTNNHFETNLGANIIINLHAVNGQQVVASKGKLIIEAPKSNKYHLTLQITDEKKDVFNANLKLLSNTKNTSTPEVLSEHNFEGKLYTHNNYNISVEGIPDINIKLYFDKLFTMKEIKERFRKKQAHEN